MSKIDQLTEAARTLPDAQLEGLIAFARDLAAGAVYDDLPPEARQSFDRGLAEHAAGLSRPAIEVFDRLRRRVDGTAA